MPFKQSDRSKNKPQSQAWAERLDTWFRHRTIVILLVLFAFCVATVTTITRPLLDLWHLYSTDIRWRENEYHKLSLLHGGMAISKVQEIMGVPIFVGSLDVSRKQSAGDITERMTESVYPGRDYWVQALHNADGAVQLIAVTSCDSSFSPSFPLSGREITLNHTTLADATGDQISWHPYALQGANHFYYYDVIPAGPPTYKVYFVGIDDACNASRDFPGLASSEGALDPRELAALIPFRRQSTPNTYAETSPLFEPVLKNNTLRVGVSLLLVRSVQQ